MGQVYHVCWFKIKLILLMKLSSSRKLIASEQGSRLGREEGAREEGCGREGE